MRDRVALPLIGLVSSLVLLAVGVLLLAPAAARPTLAPGVSLLPTLNAALNATSAVLLAAGFSFIRTRRVRAHMTAMLSAFGVSVLFLVFYVTYHAQAGSRPFTGHGWIRPVYFALLLSHIVLAAAIVPIALTTLFRAWRGDYARHRRIARWALPVWLYVSVTGVAVYLLLYRLG
jgi:putative membrane protein